MPGRSGPRARSEVWRGRVVSEEEGKLNLALLDTNAPLFCLSGSRQTISLLGGPKQLQGQKLLGFPNS